MWRIRVKSVVFRQAGDLGGFRRHFWAFRRRRSVLRRRRQCSSHFRELNEDDSEGNSPVCGLRFVSFSLLSALFNQINTKFPPISDSRWLGKGTVPRAQKRKIGLPGEALPRRIKRPKFSSEKTCDFALCTFPPSLFSTTFTNCFAEDLFYRKCPASYLYTSLQYQAWWWEEVRPLITWGSCSALCPCDNWQTASLCCGQLDEMWARWACALTVCFRADTGVGWLVPSERFENFSTNFQPVFFFWRLVFLVVSYQFNA
jgi:hypothetical protein